MRSGVPSSPVVAPTGGGAGGAASAAGSAAGRAPPKPTLENIPPQLFENPGMRGSIRSLILNVLTACLLALTVAAGLQNYIRSEPALLDQLMKVNPTMAEAVLAPTPDMLTHMLVEQQQRRKQAEDDNFRRINALNANPLDLEAQSKVRTVR